LIGHAADLKKVRTSAAFPQCTYCKNSPATLNLEIVPGYNLKPRGFFWRNLRRNNLKLHREPVARAFLVFFFAASAFAQAPAPTHAPDFRAPEHIGPLDFPPKPNAPFMAIAKTLWVQTLPDSSTVTHQNERVVARDMDGRIFQERRTFTPVPNPDNEQSIAYMSVYSDPVKHTLANCNPNLKVCNLFDYYNPVTAPEDPAGLQPDKRTFLTRENLGVDTFDDIEVQRSREIYTFFSQAIGNTKTILRTVEYWYSPQLGVNLQVKRHDPRDGDQTLWLTNITLSAPDPATFEIPQGYKIIDHRGAGLVGIAGPGKDH